MIVRIKMRGLCKRAFNEVRIKMRGLCKRAINDSENKDERILQENYQLKQ